MSHPQSPINVVHVRFVLALLFVLSFTYSRTATSQSRTSAVQKATPPPQKIDQEYSDKIKEYLQDQRVTTELVDHMPASDVVPSPLKFFGRIPGTPGELTYSKDINRYYEALSKASSRAVLFNIGKSEEGRDMVMLAIADDATIKQLGKYKDMISSLSDPRKTTEAQAQQLIHTAKPIYWITSGIHSPETGGPEMLIELAYRLIIEETPFIQNIRNNVITFITPVVETDGRERVVDTYYYGKKTGKTRPPLMYWGKYVAHDNNRDGMGQFLKLTQNITKTFVEWKPTILHDLHEAQSYLYASTGTGPYNEQIDPLTIDEWWLFAKNDVMEMTKRGVPGVWTYGYYDGWVPNYLFFIAHTHNAIGRFYEVQSYGPDIVNDLRLPPAATSREWYRPNPPLPSIKWGPRNNVNIQESALLFALSYTAKNKETLLENYWIKNKNAVNKGKNGPTFAWVIPAAQRRKADAADAINELMKQGLEVNQASTSFKAGNTTIQKGDYVIRGDQPYRTLAEMYFAIQNYSPANPFPYDDTGWTFQLMRNIKLVTVTDKSILDQPMTLIAGPVRAPGGIEGTGSTLVVDHTADNNIVTFRFKNADIRMQAAEDDFELNGHHFRAGAIVIANADRARLEPVLKDLGLSAWATSAPPQVPMHDLDVPRIGYVHSWRVTQDEGWVRAAFDTYGIPYTYFADKKLKEGNLRQKYDVIVFPHVGGSAQVQVNGTPMTGEPIPYKKSDLTPNLGGVDETDDVRGGMGFEGLVELEKFVEQGGTLIVEGATSTIFPEYKLTTGVTVESSGQLFARGSILRGVFVDKKSPLAYGYEGDNLPVYFNQDPILNAGTAPLGAAASVAGVGVNITPNANLQRLSVWEDDVATRPATAPAANAAPLAAAAGAANAAARPRVVLQFPANANDMLLSGTLTGGQVLSNRAQLVDVPLGKGHVVMFAIRPFWRWQTQGTFMLGFNAILNWNDLDAGKGATQSRASGQEQ